jgi:uncharacterized membrane protein YkvA (DUF1232 family)
MSGKKQVSNFLWMIDRLRLAWRLFWDERVSAWIKLVPLFPVLYLIWPLDILSDPVLGLGQLDDLAVIALGLKLFITACPPGLVNEHWQALTQSGQKSSEQGDTVEGEYRVLEGDQVE